LLKTRGHQDWRPLGSKKGLRERKVPGAKKRKGETRDLPKGPYYRIGGIISWPKGFKERRPFWGN